MMSCLSHHPVMQTMMTWCSCKADTNDVMPPHSDVAQMNTNAGDIMVTWIAPYMNFVMSHWACTSCTCMHGTCAISKMGT